MSRPQRIRIGTRASQLALVQAEWVGGRIRELVPEADVELVRISTKGDRILDVPLARVGGKGMFTARVLASADEQDRIDTDELRRIPTLYPGERAR